MELAISSGLPPSLLRKTWSSADFAELVSYDDLYGLPEERADTRAALIARLAGIPHSLDFRELLAPRWLGVMRGEDLKRTARRSRPRQSQASIKAAIRGVFAG